MGYILLFLSIWICSSAISRLLSRFAKTYWKNELVM